MYNKPQAAVHPLTGPHTNKQTNYPFGPSWLVFSLKKSSKDMQWKIERDWTVGIEMLAGGVCYAARLQWEIAAGEGARAPFKLTLFIPSENVRQWKKTSADPCNQFSFRMHENSNASSGSFLSVSIQCKSNKNNSEGEETLKFIPTSSLHFVFIFFFLLNIFHFSRVISCGNVLCCFGTATFEFPVS
jgi:hypothetical protein